MRVGRILMAVLALAVVAVIPAHATLLDGQTVHLTYEFPNQGTIYNGNAYDLLVGPGFEINNFPSPDHVVNVDFSDTNILTTFNFSSTFTPTAFNGFHVFDGLGLIPAFTSVTINPATTLAGLDGSRISFDADNIWVNWQGLAFNTETVVSIDLTGAAVPEPTTLVLLGSGIIGVVSRRRRS